MVQQALGSLFHRSGDLDRAEAAVRTAIRLHRAFRRGSATQPSLYLLGAILYTRGEFATAKRYFEHALRLAQRRLRHGRHRQGPQWAGGLRTRVRRLRTHA